MSESISVRSPLIERAGSLGNASVHVEEVPFLAYVNLRLDPAEGGAMMAASTVLDLELPVDSNTVSKGESNAALWMGPDEWLIVGAENSEVLLASSLGSAIGDTHAAITEVGGGYTTLRVSGSKARDILSRGTTIDLHERHFGIDQCAQSTFAHASALIWQRDASPVFDLIVRRSFADYLYIWLQDAAHAVHA